MTAQHIRNRSYGETIGFTIAAKDRDQSVITSPASQTLSLVIGVDPLEAPLLTFDAPPQVTLIDPAAGRWLISVRFADYSGQLAEDVLYYGDYPADTSATTFCGLSFRISGTSKAAAVVR